jgi:hypothetical protein
MKKQISILMVLFFITNFNIANIVNIIYLENKPEYPDDNDILDISKLEPGDIAFKHPEIFPDRFPTIIDHCLLFIKYNETTDEYVFIEASVIGSQVRYRNESEDTITGETWGPFGRVKTANSTQKSNAIDFVKRQLGREFQGEWINKNYNPEDTVNDSLADEWYCSELIWAAYINCNNPFPKNRPNKGYVYGQGINLDWNKGSIVKPKDIKNNIIHIRIFYLNKNESKKSVLTDNNSNILLQFENFFKFDNIISEYRKK